MGDEVRDLQLHADPAITASDLSLGYQERPGKVFQAVEGINIRVQKGSSLAVLGESGAGKSTLATYLAGHGADSPAKSDRIRRMSGEARVFDTALTKPSGRMLRRITAHIGYLPQDAGAKLAPDLNVGDLIFQPIEERIPKFDRNELGPHIAEMFEILGMPLTFLQKYPYELSKGQRQRVAVLRSLVHTPSVYVADEPTLGVDANNRPKIVELIEWYRARSNPTMLIVSHDIGLLEALIEDVLIMQRGAAVGFGNINSIFRHATHEYVVKLADALRTSAYDEIAAE